MLSIKVLQEFKCEGWLVVLMDTLAFVCHFVLCPSERERVDKRAIKCQDRNSRMKESTSFIVLFFNDILSLWVILCCLSGKGREQTKKLSNVRKM